MLDCDSLGCEVAEQVIESSAGGELTTTQLEVSLVSCLGVYEGNTWFCTSSDEEIVLVRSML